MKILKITIVFLALVSLQITAAQWVESKTTRVVVGGVPVAAPGGALTQVASATNASGEDIYSLATGSRTLAADNNSCLVCVIGAYSYNSSTVSSVKWGSGESYEQSFTKLNAAGTDHRAEIWYLVNWPTTLTGTITAEFGDEYDAMMSCTEWTGVNQTTPLENFNSATGINTNAPSITITSETGAKVVDIIVGSSATLTVGADQTQQMNLLTGSERAASSIQDGAASVAMSWASSDTDRYFAIAGASINPN